MWPSVTGQPPSIDGYQQHAYVQGTGFYNYVELF